MPFAPPMLHCTVKELAAAYLDYAKTNTDPTTFVIYRTIVLDFLNKLYGDGTLVDDFKPSCLKLVREAMVQSCRFRVQIVSIGIRRSDFIRSCRQAGYRVETAWKGLQRMRDLAWGWDTFGPETPTQ